MLRKSTIFALLVLVGLVAFTVYLRQEKDAPEQAEPTGTPDSYVLFGSEKGIANHITISSRTQGTVELLRKGEAVWVVQQPVEGIAEPSQAEAAATQISALRVLNEVDVTLSAAGLDFPDYTLTVEFTGGARHVLKIGSLTPSGTGYYGQLDDGPVAIISVEGVQSLLGLLSTPPYLETPTASPLPPTPAPSLSVTGTGTPEGAAVTPTP